MLTQVWWMRPSRNTFNPKLFVGVVRPKKEPSAIQMIREVRFHTQLLNDFPNQLTKLLGRQEKRV